MGKNKENLLPNVSYISSENLIKTGIQIAPAQFVVEKSSYLRKQNIKEQSYVLGTSVLSSSKRGSVTTSDTFQYFVAETQPTIQSQTTTTTDICPIYMEESTIADCVSATKEASVPFYKYGFFHGFHKYLTFIVMFMSLLTGASVMTSCHKEPYDVVIDWDWVNPPDKELIRQYANDKNTQKIILNLRPYNSTSYTPAIFHRVYDSLYMNCFSIDPAKITGEGNIYVDEFNGAHLPDPYADDITGMAEIDSVKYKQIGFNIERGFPISR